MVAPSPRVPPPDIYLELAVFIIPHNSKLASII
jgi:hypothetical protein